MSGFMLSCLKGFLLSVLLGGLRKSKAVSIFEVYQRINGFGYWVKCLFMFVILFLKKITQVVKPKGTSYYLELDKEQKLPSTNFAVDAVFFNGANKNGDHIAIGTARRPNRLIDGFLYLKLKDFGLLQTPKLPDTSLFNSSDNEESYEAEGIKVMPLESMKKWRITYTGQLVEAENHNKLHDVKIDAVYTSDEPFFDYEYQMDSWSMATILSFEKWGKSYFKNLQDTHQRHYEQFGILRAHIWIDGRELDIDLETVRDHSIGKHRDWASFKRYVLHWVTLENGDHISIGSVCAPLVYSRMQIGYIYKSRENKMYPIVNSNLHLYHYGEQGTPSRDYAFTFNAGGKDYEMQVNITDAPYFYISKEWEAKVFECLCKVEVNGVKGWGGVEWEYRNVEGRRVT